MPQPRLMTAQSAAARLGVSRATLYAYVSRGLVHAHPDGSDPRRRCYSAADTYPIDRCLALLPLAGVGAAMTWQRDPRRVRTDAAALLRLMAAAATGTAPNAMPAHLAVARAWGLDDRAAAIIRAALILCAD